METQRLLPHLDGGLALLPGEDTGNLLHVFLHALGDVAQRLEQASQTLPEPSA
jgi:hypothetical protein